MAYSIRAGQVRRSQRRSPRKKINGTPEAPPSVVTRSNRHMVAQVIDGWPHPGVGFRHRGRTGAEGTKTDKARKVGADHRRIRRPPVSPAVVFDRGGNSTQVALRPLPEPPVRADLESCERAERRDHLMAAQQRDGKRLFGRGRGQRSP